MFIAAIFSIQSSHQDIIANAKKLAEAYPKDAMNENMVFEPIRKDLP